jgi:hypothetical protein
MLSFTKASGGGTTDVSGGVTDEEMLDLADLSGNDYDLSGAGVPPPPPATQKALDTTVAIPVSQYTAPPDSGAPLPFSPQEPSPTIGGSASYMDALPEEPYVVANPYVEPALTVRELESTPAPAEPYAVQGPAVTPDAQIQVPGPVNIMDIVPMKQTGGEAPVGTVDTIPVRQVQAERMVQLGGEAPVGSVNTVPVRQVQAERTIQLGGEAPVNHVDPVPPFQNHPYQVGGEPKPAPPAVAQIAKPYAPALDKEPFVIANPYVAPPLTQQEQQQAPAPAPPQPEPAPATATQQVSNELFNQAAQQGGKVNVFENADIQVIKLL